MVYAHRSVDLVVAVIGVLKVGAAFSVIGMFRASSKLASREVMLCRSRVSSFAPDYLPSCRPTPWFNCTQRCWGYQPDGPRFYCFRTSSLRRGTCIGITRRWRHRWGSSW
jgi:hypothetical protein